MTVKTQDGRLAKRGKATTRTIDKASDAARAVVDPSRELAREVFTKIKAARDGRAAKTR